MKLSVWQKIIISSVLITYIALVSGCGMTGPLYPPSDKRAQPQKSTKDSWF